MRKRFFRRVLSKRDKKKKEKVKKRVKNKKTVKHKKPVKKVVAKRKKSGKTSSFRRKFDVFAKGIKRLEELRAELNKLNVEGHEKEVNSIRSKLKNVSYIPEIEEEMKILKEKIKGVYKAKEGEEKKKPRKRRKIEKPKELLKIPEIEVEVKALKSMLARQQEGEKRKRELMKEIDPDINLMVDNKFDLTLNEIKAELSKKLKDKELFMQEQLQKDLDMRKQEFELRYEDLKKKFAEKYGERIENSLQKEVGRRFNDLVKERVDQIKKKLHIEKEREVRNKERELRESFESEFSKKLAKKEEFMKTRVAQALQRFELIKARLEERLAAEADKKILARKKVLEERQRVLKRSLMAESKRRLARERGELREREAKILADLARKHAKLKSVIEAEKKRGLKEKREELKAIGKMKKELARRARS